MPDGGNIGYPAAPYEIKAISSLLEKTAPRMSRKQRDEITAYLAKNAPRPTRPQPPTAP